MVQVNTENSGVESFTPPAQMSTPEAQIQTTGSSVNSQVAQAGIFGNTAPPARPNLYQRHSGLGLHLEVSIASSADSTPSAGDLPSPAITSQSHQYYSHSTTSSVSDASPYHHLITPGQYSAPLPQQQQQQQYQFQEQYPNMGGMPLNMGYPFPPQPAYGWTPATIGCPNPYLPVMYPYQALPINNYTQYAQAIPPMDRAYCPPVYGLTPNGTAAPMDLFPTPQAEEDSLPATGYASPSSTFTPTPLYNIQTPAQSLVELVKEGKIHELNARLRTMGRSGPSVSMGPAYSKEFNGLGESARPRNPTDELDEEADAAQAAHPEGKPATNAEGKKKRSRTAQACEKCRIRKARCHGGNPCSRCTKRGFACEFASPTRHRGPAKLVKSETSSEVILQQPTPSPELNHKGSLSKMAAADDYIESSSFVNPEPRTVSGPTAATGPSTDKSKKQKRPKLHSGPAIAFGPSPSGYGLGLEFDPAATNAMTLTQGFNPLTNALVAQAFPTVSGDFQQRFMTFNPDASFNNTFIHSGVIPAGMMDAGAMITPQSEAPSISGLIMSSASYADYTPLPTIDSDALYTTLFNPDMMGGNGNGNVTSGMGYLQTPISPEFTMGADLEGSYFPPMDRYTNNENLNQAA